MGQYQNSGDTKAPQLAIENVSIGHLAALFPEAVFPDFEGAQYEINESSNLNFWGFWKIWITRHVEFGHFDLIGTNAAKRH